MAERKNYPLTLAELEREIKIAIAKFGKDKYVMLSDDEECNGIHECYYSFTNGKDFDDFYRFPFELDKKDCVVLG